jgi:hypothetical protein
MTFLGRGRLTRAMPDPRIGIGLCCFVALTLWAGEPANNRDQSSRVESKTFISPDNPKIRVTVDSKFEYIGSVPFTIDNVAAGNRYVFVRATPDKHIHQMFIIQQEGFLPSSNDTYKYSITTPARLGRFEYQHSVILEDNDATIREEPGKEADVTQRFLAAHGYVLEPELVMSRFARPADLQHKHEIIFFCYENLSSYGHKLADFAASTDSQDKRSIKQRVDENCRNAFRVSD